MTGSSQTWYRSGWRVSMHTSPPHVHCGGRSFCTRSTSSTGNSLRVFPLWPGCPPRLRWDAGLDSLPRAAAADGPSLDGGVDEFDEFVRSLSSRSATREVRAATCATRSRTKRCIAGVADAQSDGDNSPIAASGKTEAGCGCFDMRPSHHGHGRRQQLYDFREGRAGERLPVAMASSGHSPHCGGFWAS